MSLFQPTERRRVVVFREDFDRTVVEFLTSILAQVAATGAADVTIVLDRKRVIAVKRVIGFFIRETVHQRLVSVYTVTCRKDRRCSNTGS